MKESNGSIKFILPTLVDCFMCFFFLFIAARANGQRKQRPQTMFPIFSPF